MNKDKVQCQICKDWFKQITATHLRIEHDITFKKYKEMFPGAETHPQKLRDKLVDANVERWSDPDYKERTAKSISDKNKIVMNDPEMTKKLKAGSKRRWSNEEERERQRRTILKQWEDPTFRRMQSEKIKKQWEDDDFRSAVIEAGKKQTGENNPFYNPEIDIWIEENTDKHVCKCGCGRYIIIERDQYHNGIPKYYCKECYNNDISGENNPMFGRKHSDNTKQLMGEIANERWSNLEERILMSCRLQGVTRENWQGFKTSEYQQIRASPEYKQWRTSVYERDNYTCQICGQYGGELNGHHIYKFSDNPDLIFEINNGITLCYDCHFHKVNGHEKEYEIELLSKIFDNKGINIFGGKMLTDKQNKLSDYY